MEFQLSITWITTSGKSLCMIPRKSVQRRGASRFTQRQIERRRRLAPGTNFQIMHLRSRVIVLLPVAVVGLTAFVVATPKPAAPAAVSVLAVTEVENRKRIIVEFLCRDAAGRFGEAHQLQIRVAGRWQPPLSVPKFEDGYLFQRTNSQRLACDLPLQAEACRFSLGYRIG